MKKLTCFVFGALVLVGCKKKVMMPDNPMTLNLRVAGDSAAATSFDDVQVEITQGADGTTLKLDTKTSPYDCELKGKFSEDVPGFTTFTPTSGTCRSPLMGGKCRTSRYSEGKLAWKVPEGSPNSEGAWDLSLEPQAIVMKTPKDPECEKNKLSDAAITLTFRRMHTPGRRQ